MQETYTGKEDQTFDALGIFPLKTLALETKSDDEEFEEYDPDQITLKVIAWKRDIVVLDDQEMDPPKIRISKEDTLEHLVEKLSKKFKIRKEKLRIFKRKAYGQGKAIEEFTTQKNMSRKLKILRINDGLCVFIEDGSYEHPEIEKYSFLQSNSVS